MANFLRLPNIADIDSFIFGPLAQLGERQVRNLEVRGSIPLRSIEKAVKCLNFAAFLYF